jgi:hypothetical protein
MGDEWRRNGTCGACIHFQSDFGAAPNFYGHCKMYPRSGSRTSNDSTCHEFKPLAGFEDKVVLQVRTHVPETTRRTAAPAYSEKSGDAAGVVVRRRDGEEVDVTPEPSSSATPLTLAAAIDDPAGALDPAQMEDALLDLVESYGALAPVTLAGELEGAVLLVKPADTSLKPHEIEVETFFHKFVMIRDRIRVLEQKVNAHDGLSDLEKVELHAPITRLYAALTSFNSLFRPSAAGWRGRRPTRRPLEDLLRRVSPREAVELGQKWVGGGVVVRTPGEGEGHTFSIDLLFERICRLKKRFRELEHAVKSHPKLSGDDKATLLDYVAKCYGTLTTFNALFRHREDWFSSK